MKKIISAIALQKRISIIELVILTIVGLAIFCNDLLSVEFQPDETFWIVSSVRLDEFVKGNLESAVWDERLDTYEVRPIPSYFAAISQRLGNVKPADIPPDYWNWSESIENNILNGAMPADKVLYYSRLPMAILGVFSIVLMTIMLAFTHSRLAGYIFYIFCFNDYFLLHLRRAMSESSLLFFTVLVMAAMFRLLSEIKNKNVKQIFIWSIIVGVISGFAGQSKLTGLACAILAIGLSFLSIYRYGLAKQKIGLKIFRLTSILISFVTVIIFIASYPFFYQKTIQRIAGTFYTRQSVVKIQMTDFPADIIEPGQRLNILLNRVFDYPYHIPNNDNNLIIPIFMLSITSFGIYYAIKQILSDNEETHKYLVLLFSLLTFGVPMLITPLDWDRYYLYPIFFSGIFFSIGFVQLSKILIENILKVFPLKIRPEVASL
jgi:hypothetical protein